MNNIKAKIFNIQKFSIHDGPGIRTTVFFKGCPMKCLWCSNPESQSREVQVLKDYSLCINCGLCDSPDTLEVKACPVAALSLAGAEYTVEDVLDVCLQDKDFYDESGGGVTLGGGEIMLYSEFAVQLLQALKENNVHCAIETAGFITSDIFRKVVEHVDLTLFDVKHHDPLKHKKGTGVDNSLILSNLRLLIEEKKDYIVRLPVIPLYNDSLKDASLFAKLFSSLGVNKVQLLPFHNFGENKYKLLNIDYKYFDEKSIHPESLSQFMDIIKSDGINCFI